MSKMIGPFTLSLHIHVKNDDAKQQGSVEFSLAAGRLPTLEELHEAIGESLAQLPEVWRLLDDREFFNRVLAPETTGRVGHFAVPEEFEYDVDELTVNARAAYVPKAEAPRRCRSRNDEEE